MAPLIKELQRLPEEFIIKVCVTAQHREMLDQVLDFFDIQADYDLNVMKKNQSLFDITIETLKGLESVLDEYTPDVIFVQGDTSTAFVGALSGFYKKISIAHIEAGLRSSNKLSPYPEEINRILADHISDYFFAPTRKAKQNLFDEGIKNNVWVVGNTVIDALFLTLDIIKKYGESKYYQHFKSIDFSKKIVLITGHRRESFGKPFENIADAINEISCFHNVEIVYPVHLNPNVRDLMSSKLKNTKNIHLMKPLDYDLLVWLMSKSYLVLTDSGGIQEEAPSLNKPVMVMRDCTERTEGILAGTAKLVGTNKDRIVDEIYNLLNHQKEYEKMAKSINPYGDGKSSMRIIDVLREVI